MLSVAVYYTQTYVLRQSAANSRPSTYRKGCNRGKVSLQRLRDCYASAHSFVRTFMCGIVFYAGEPETLNNEPNTQLIADLKAANGRRGDAANWSYFLRAQFCNFWRDCHLQVLMLNPPTASSSRIARPGVVLNCSSSARSCDFEETHS